MSIRRRRITVFPIVNTIILSLLAAVTLLPLVYLVYGSFIDPRDYFEFGVTFPLKRISLANYEILLFQDGRVPRAFGISVYVTALGTILSTVVTGALAYPLNKRDLPFKTAITFFIFFTMLFGGGLVPTYLVVKGLGLFNNHLSLILPGLVGAWYVFLFRNFFATIPVSLEESAVIDGANEVQIFTRIMLPLSQPIIFTVGLFYAVSYWNKWFDALIYLFDSNMYPLQLILRNIIYSSENMAAAGQSGSAASVVSAPPDVLKMCAIVVSTAPIASIYPFVQKHFIKGVLVGAIKG